jgi:Mrp family chromosome partitioning ATPase
LTLREYLRVLWRWKWVVIITVCLSTLAAYVYSWRQAPQYAATASIMYVEPVDPSNPLASSPYSGTRDLAVENVVNLIGSASIAEAAQEILDEAPAGPYGIATSVRGGSTEGTGGVIDVSAISGYPAEAAALANAYAQAAVDARRNRQSERIEVAVRAVKAKLEGFTTAESRLSADYILLEQQLADLELLETTATGDFELISEAFEPRQPFAPQPTRSAALGMGVGLLAGVGLTLLFNQLTTKVRSKHEAGEVLGLPVIGSIPEIDRQSLAEGPLIALNHPDGPAAEALRLLRSNLDYLNVDDATSLMITSSLSGEGKSMTACNLAVTMAMAGRKVTIVDGDLRRPRVHDYFGLSNDVGLSSVVAGELAAGEALLRVDLPTAPKPGANANSKSASDERVRVNPRVTVGGVAVGAERATALETRSARELLVLPAGPQVSNPGEVVASSRFGQVMNTLETDGTDLVIVDAPPLLEVGDAAAMAAQVKALVVVVDLKKVRHDTLVETRHMLNPLPCTKLGTILVKTKDGTSGYGYYSR